LKGSDALVIAKNIQNIRDGYEALIKVYIVKMAKLADSSDMREMFIQKELFSQLKKIGKTYAIVYEFP